MFVKEKKYQALLNRHIALVESHNELVKLVERYLDLVSKKVGSKDMTITEFWNEKKRITNELKRCVRSKKARDV